STKLHSPMERGGEDVMAEEKMTGVEAVFKVVEGADDSDEAERLVRPKANTQSERSRTPRPSEGEQPDPGPGAEPSVIDLGGRDEHRPRRRVPDRLGALRAAHHVGPDLAAVAARQVTAEVPFELAPRRTGRHARILHRRGESVDSTDRLTNDRRCAI